jgi:hypothetical protein
MFSFSQASDWRSRERLDDRRSRLGLLDTDQAAAREAGALPLREHGGREVEVTEHVDVSWLGQLRRACADPAAGYEL